MHDAEGGGYEASAQGRSNVRLLVGEEPSVRRLDASRDAKLHTTGDLPVNQWSFDGESARGDKIQRAAGGKKHRGRPVGDVRKLPIEGGNGTVGRDRLRA